MPNDLKLDLFDCPQCGHGPLLDGSNALTCGACAQAFPIIGQIPWLVRDPGFHIEQWKARFQLLLKTWTNDEERLKRELAEPRLSPASRKRLMALLQGKVEHRKEYSELIAPMHLNLAANIDRELTFRSTLPESMHLMGYNANVFRDWTWGTEENEKSLQLFKIVTGLTSLAGCSVLTVGAGASRFPYDVHRSLQPALTIANDINPYLLMVASKVTRGGSITLYDFPVAPIDDEHVQVKHKLRAPQKVNAGFHIIAADGVNFPGKEQVFDWVITPWFIDVVGVDTRLIAGKINRLLKPGGCWYNFGTLVYHQKSFAKNYGKAEIRELVQGSGFSWEVDRSESLPYLQDPASAQRRWESVWAFVAKKQEHVPATPRIEVWPDWLLDQNQPVPRLPEMERTVAINANYNWLMQQIDGRRSITDVAAEVGPHFQMSSAEASAMLRQLLMRIVESSGREQRF